MKQRLPDVFAAASILLAATSALAAPHVKPPLVAIRDYSAVVLQGQVLSLDAANSTVGFQIERGINAERAAASVNIRIPPAALSLLGAKTDYLFVVIDEHNDPKNPGTKIPLETPELLVYDGAGPAIYLASDQTRALFEDSHKAVEASANYKAQLLAGLNDVDSQLADLYCAELITRVDLRAALTPAEIEALMRSVSNEALRPETRARILDAAASHFFAASPEQTATAALAVLAQVPNVGAGGLENTDILAISALNYFNNSMDVPKNVPSELLLPFIKSPQPAIAETSLRILVRTEPSRVDQFVADALRYSLLPREARLILMRHRKRQATN
jgi:hypothetical protein